MLWRGPDGKPSYLASRQTTEVTQPALACLPGEIDQFDSNALAVGAKPVKVNLSKVANAPGLAYCVAKLSAYKPNHQWWQDDPLQQGRKSDAQTREDRHLCGIRPTVHPQTRKREPLNDNGGDHAACHETQN